MPKEERAAAKAAAKDAYKLAKKAKLDPDQAKTSLDVQREQAGGGEGAAAETPNNTNKGATLQFNIGAGGASREALKAKLAARLEALRGQRKAEERAVGAAKAKEWKKKKAEGGGKAEKGGKGGKPAVNGKAAGATGRATKPDSTTDDGGEGGMVFGKMQLPAKSANRGKRGAKKPSKTQLLAQATANKEKAAALASTKEGEEFAAQEAWKSAIARAQGERVLDDPKLLRKSIKKEGKLKAKSRDAWKERTKKEEEKKDAKQKKRKDNLKRRSDAKIQKKKDKRDKKLLRPGFEGRRVGSIQKQS